MEIAISHCGICHSDVHLVDGDWGVGTYPMVPGHEIVGSGLSAWVDGELAVVWKAFPAQEDQKR